MGMDNPLDSRKTYTSTLEITGIAKAAERFEEFFSLMHVKSSSVVTNKENSLPIMLFNAESYLGRRQMRCVSLSWMLMASPRASRIASEPVWINCLRL